MPGQGLGIVLALWLLSCAAAFSPGLRAPPLAFRSRRGQALDAALRVCLSARGGRLPPQGAQKKAAVVPYAAGTGAGGSDGSLALDTGAELVRGL